MNLRLQTGTLKESEKALLDKTIEGLISPKSSQSNDSSTFMKRPVNLRDRLRGSNTNSSDKKQPMFSQSMTTIPSEKPPRSLKNKLEHLMQDTKSSAMRVAINTGKIACPTDLEQSPQKRTPNKMKRASPSKLNKTSKSPMKKTNDPATSFLLTENLHLDYDPSPTDDMTLEGIAGMV